MKAKNLATIIVARLDCYNPKEFLEFWRKSDTVGKITSGANKYLSYMKDSWQGWYKIKWYLIYFDQYVYHHYYYYHHDNNNIVVAY